MADCVWDYAGEMTLLNAFWRTAAEVAPEQVAGHDERTTMRLCADGDLAGLWRAMGLHDVRSAPLVVSATYVDFNDLWLPFLTGVGPAGLFCQSLDQEKRTALSTALRDHLAVGDRPFELSARAWAAAGKVG